MTTKTSLVQIILVLFIVGLTTFGVWGVWASIQALQGAKPPTQIETQLAAANITLSSGSPSDVAEVRRYLDQDLAYQALAGNILNLLNGRKLTGIAVPLVLINGEYKKLYGVNPDGYLPADKYGDSNNLRIAIFSAWKQYNSKNSKNSFEEIVESSTPSSKPN